MAALIQAEIGAENVADAMSDDPAFACDIWRVLAERLAMGALADELGDLVATSEDREGWWLVFAQFRETFGTIEEAHKPDD